MNQESGKLLLRGFAKFAKICSSTICGCLVEAGVRAYVYRKVFGELDKKAALLLCPCHAGSSAHASTLFSPFRTPFRPAPPAGPFVSPYCRDFVFVKRNANITGIKNPYAWLSLEVAQLTDSLEEITEVDPLELAEIFGNIGGFWGE